MSRNLDDTCICRPEHEAGPNDPELTHNNPEMEIEYMGRKQEQIDDLETDNLVLIRRVRELYDEVRRLQGTATSAEPSTNSDKAKMMAAVYAPPPGPSRTDSDDRGEIATEEAMDEEFRAFRQKAVDDDLQAIRELHRPPAVQNKAESALDIVRSNNAQRAELTERARNNAQLISRVASALGIDVWDEDGTEILAKAQRWASVAHWIKQRQKLATGAVANELGTILTALVAPRDLSSWIMSKTTGVVPESAVEVAQAAQQQPVWIPDKQDLEWIRDACASFALLRREPDRGEWIAQALKTQRGTRELLLLLSLVLLPFLRILEPASGGRVP